MPVTKVVHVAKDRELAELLRGSGGRHEKFVNELVVCADPNAGGRTTASFFDGMENNVARDLEVLLRRTPDDHPARPKLAGLAAQFGVSVHEPAPEPPAPSPGVPAQVPPPAV